MLYKEDEHANGTTERIHDLRRSTIRNMRRAGADESVAMTISGHKSSQVFGRYDITSHEDQ